MKFLNRLESNMKKIIFIAVFFAAAIPAAQLAAAQTEAYPARPVRLIVAFPPGGSVDVVARLVAPRLWRAWGSRFSSTTAAAPRAISERSSRRARGPTATRC